jgi:alcohol dehydrogenase class IV
MANMACGNAQLGLAHAITQPMEGMFKIPHGVALGTILPHIMEFNLLASQQRFMMLAKNMGEFERVDRSAGDLATGAIYAIKKLLLDIGFPRKFSEPQVDRKYIPQMAKMLMAGLYGGEYDFNKEYPLNTVIPISNIRKTTLKNVIELYERAFEGWEMEPH